MRFDRTLKEGSNVVLIQWKENGRGCFLMVSVVSEVGKARFIVIPEGINGYGWENMVTALSDLLRKWVELWGLGHQSIIL